MQIYIYRDNQQLGPFTEAEIKAKLASGAISLEDNVWWEGQAGWTPLGQSSLAATLAPTSPASAPKGPFPETSAVINAPVQETSKLAIWALVCGCLSVICWPFTSIPAIILGHMGLSEIKKNPAIQGRGLALAGVILGYIFTTLIALYLILVFVVVASMSGQIKESFKTINSQMNAAQTNSQSATESTQPPTPPAATNAPSTNVAPVNQ